MKKLIIVIAITVFISLSLSLYNYNSKDEVIFNLKTLNKMDFSYTFEGKRLASWD
jgi:hypothetical protein